MEGSFLRGLSVFLTLHSFSVTLFALSSRPFLIQLEINTLIIFVLWGHRVSGIPCEYGGPGVFGDGFPYCPLNAAEVPLTLVLTDIYVILII